MHHDQQQITAELARIARNGLPGLTADNAIISRLDALNLLINIHDDRGADATPLRGLLPAIAADTPAADSAPLHALYRLIYGRSLDDAGRAPAPWLQALKSRSLLYLRDTEDTAPTRPSDHLAILSYSIINEPQEAYTAADSRCNSLLHTLLSGHTNPTPPPPPPPPGCRTLQLQLQIDLLHARLASAGTFSFPSSTAPLWAPLASSLAATLSDPDTLQNLPDTPLLRWHTALSLLPPFRLLPATSLAQASNTALAQLSLRPNLRIQLIAHLTSTE